MKYSDAALTVAMHNGLPRLLDALEQLEDERDQPLAHVRRVESGVGPPVLRFGGPPEQTNDEQHP